MLRERSKRQTKSQTAPSHDPPSLSLPSPSSQASPSSKNRSGNMIPTHHNSRPSLTINTASSSVPIFTLTSFTIPNITDLTVTIPGSNSRSDSTDPETNTYSSKSRWRTPEFMFYGLVFVVAVPFIVYWPIWLSSNLHPNYLNYAARLSPGWLFGRQVDASDPQYRSFRSNLLSLLALSTTYLTFSHFISYFTSSNPQSSTIRARFIAIFSCTMMVILHGFSALKILLILAANYRLAKMDKSKLGDLVKKTFPFLVVVGNMCMLFVNERFDGWHIGGLHAALGALDDMGGLLPRWHVGFNITMLRIVSFSLDYHWRENISDSRSVPIDYRGRITTGLGEDDYSFVNFVAYCLYPPLYIAGPIITFNDFLWQLKQPLSIPFRDRVTYAIRFIFCFLTMETVLHTMYVVAIKDTHAWAGDSPADLSMIGFWNLIIVWLKLLIPWRFFRMWALWDGIDPPENMIRCVANNYSTLGFWRSWHRSYNLWLLRYIYIPVGGKKNVIVASLLVFTFVALWHDLSFKLLAWGWLVTLFILPELLARHFLPPTSSNLNSKWYRHVVALGGVGNILLMMVANLVGFVLGLDGTKELIRKVVSEEGGWVFGVVSLGCLFVGVQVMMEYREEEKRQGIDRKC